VPEIEHLRVLRRTAWRRRRRTCGGASPPTWAPAPQSAAAAGLRTKGRCRSRALSWQGRRHDRRVSVRAARSADLGDERWVLLPSTGGRVHIPAPYETQRFCAGGHFTDCPVNQRWSPVRPAEPAW